MSSSENRNEIKVIRESTIGKNIKLYTYFIYSNFYILISYSMMVQSVG